MELIVTVVRDTCEMKYTRELDGGQLIRGLGIFESSMLGGSLESRHATFCPALQ